MGNNNSGIIALLALLGVAYFVSKPQEKEVSTINGSQFPWLTPSVVYVPTKEIQVLEKMTTVHEYHTDRVHHYQTVAEEAEERVEEHKLAYLDVLKGLEKAKAVQKEVAILKEMVQPTTTFDPTRLTEEDLAKSQALADISRPAAGMWHPPSVPIE